MGRPSSIKGKPMQSRVDMMLAGGASISEVSAATGAHPSSVWRYSQIRKSHLARIVNDEPNSLDLVARLQAAADDACRARVIAAESGSHAAHARAIKNEADILAKLLGELGVDDATQGDINRQVESMLVAIREFAQQHPQHARPLIDALTANNQTHDLGLALAGQIESTA